MHLHRPPAFFVADAPGLDLLNSRLTPGALTIEWLASGADLLDWLEQARLVPTEIAEAMRSNTAVGELDAVAAKTRALREWFRGFVQAHRGRPLGSTALAELAELNRVLAQDAVYGAIVPNAGPDLTQDSPASFEFQWRRHWRTPDSLLFPIAQAMADLICAADFAQIKACEGPACSIVFLDKTKGHARRWCSMAACGNRAKQAAHRARTREAGQSADRI
jgi:predicted RNA-binding Zn ribbon-like protein